MPYYTFRVFISNEIETSLFLTEYSSIKVKGFNCGKVGL